MPKVSIIMPVYNTGNVLYKAVQSILDQTFSDFELLLIDDGSVDGSENVCDEFSNRDPRVKTFHKQNGGISDARNYGLKKAIGEFIAFADHDDIYLPELLEKSVFAITESGADAVKFRYQTDYVEQNVIWKLPKLSNKIILIDDLPSSSLKLISNNYLETVWSFLYKRSLLELNALFFETEFKHGHEDVQFNYRVLPFIKKLVILPDILYIHYVRGTLSTSAKFYEDVLSLIAQQIDWLNRYIQIVSIDIVQQKSLYTYCCAEYLVGYLSYGIRLGKSYQDLYIELKKLKMKILNSSIDFGLCKWSMRYAFIWFLFVNEYYMCLYVLFQVKIKYKQISSKFKIFISTQFRAHNRCL